VVRIVSFDVNRNIDVIVVDHFSVNSVNASLKGADDMEIKVQNPTGMRLEAQLGEFTVATDQPVADGGENSAPSPFDLFLASLATCAGYYALAFCRQRDLPTEGISVTMTNDWNENKHLAEKISIDIHLPADIPAKYHKAIRRAAGMCTVKRHLEKPPVFDLRIRNGRPD
jgi:putative redox protein